MIPPVQCGCPPTRTPERVSAGVSLSSAGLCYVPASALATAPVKPPLLWYGRLNMITPPKCCLIEQLDLDARVVKFARREAVHQLTVRAEHFCPVRAADLI